MNMFPTPDVRQPNGSPALRYGLFESEKERRTLALKATEAPRIPWETFVRSVFTWNNGEHLALIGPTGQGKTTLLSHLVNLHPYVVVFATKPKDDTMDRFIKQGFVKIERWRSLDPKDFPRRVLWPNAGNLATMVDTQQEVFNDAMGKIYREGGWSVIIDELWYFVNVLKMPAQVKLYLLQARSLGISLAVATQRPAFIPLEVYDQSTHLFFFRDNDETNLRRLSGISWRSADLIRNILADLEQYQFLYINTRTGLMYRSRSPAATDIGRRVSNGYS